MATLKPEMKKFFQRDDQQTEEVTGFTRMGNKSKDVSNDSRCAP
jgi:hypothetical protein